MRICMSFDYWNTIYDFNPAYLLRDECQGKYSHAQLTLQALMLFIAAAEHIVALSVGEEIEVFVLRRIEGSLDGFNSGIADRSGRQTWIQIGIVRRGNPGIIGGQYFPADPTLLQDIIYRWAALQRHPQLQSVLKHTRDNAPLIMVAGFFLNDRGQDQLLVKITDIIGIDPRLSEFAEELCGLESQDAVGSAIDGKLVRIGIQKTFQGFQFHSGKAVYQSGICGSSMQALVIHQAALLDAFQRTIQRPALRKGDPDAFAATIPEPGYGLPQAGSATKHIYSGFEVTICLPQPCHQPESRCTGDYAGLFQLV